MAVAKPALPRQDEHDGKLPDAWGAIVGDGEEEDGGEEGDVEPATLAWKCRQFDKIKFLTVFLLLLLLKQTITPSIPYITNTFFARPHGGSDVDCSLTPSSRPCQRGVSEAAHWYSMSDAVSHLVSMPAAVALGSFSDRIGRVPILQASTVLSAVVFVALAAHVLLGCSLWIYLVANPIVESFDCNGVFMAIFLSDIENVIPVARERMAASKMGIAIYTPFALVSMVVSHLAPRREAMYASLAGTAATVGWIFFCFPECAKLGTKPKEVGSCTAVDDAKRVLLRNGFMLRMVLIVALTGFVAGGKGIIYPPFMMGHIGMTKEDKLWLSIVVTPVALLCFVASFPLMTRFGEVRILQLGCGVSVLSPILTMFCTDLWQIAAVLCISIGPSLGAGVAVLRIKSALVAKDEQGTVQGITASVGKGAATCGLLFFGWQFNKHTHGGQNLSKGILVPLFTLSVVESLTFLVACSLPRQIPSPDGPKVERSSSQEGLLANRSFCSESGSSSTTSDSMTASDSDSSSSPSAKNLKEP